MKKYPMIISAIILAGLLSVYSNCSKNNGSGGGNPPPPPPPTTGITAWITKGDKSVLLEKQSALIPFGTTTNTNPTVEVDSTTSYQTVDGFGYSLTGGSAYLINRLAGAQKSALLEELFGSSDNSISISYLRISIGASDLNAEVFSYDDMPAGQTDVNLANFNLSKDTVDVIPLLKEILLIN